MKRQHMTSYVMMITRLQVYWSVQMDHRFQHITDVTAIYKTLCTWYVAPISPVVQHRFYHRSWPGSSSLCVCLLATHACTPHVWMPYLLILGCLQVVVDQLKVQTVFLLQGGMELCFLRNEQEKQKESLVHFSIMIHYLPHCKDFYGWLHHACKPHSATPS